MKKLLLLSALLIFACSSDDEGNPCVYEPTLSTQHSPIIELFLARP